MDENEISDNRTVFFQSPEEVCLRFEETLKDAVNAFADNPNECGNSIYKALIQAKIARDIILDTVGEYIPKETASECLGNIRNGILYLVDQFDNRLLSIDNNYNEIIELTP